MSAILQSLSHQGYAVLETHTGPDALSACGSHEGTIDLLLTDLQLPGMPGREVARQVRLLYPNVRLLFISGYDHLQTAPESTEFAVFRKPFTANALIEKVNQVMHQNEKRGKSI